MKGKKGFSLVELLTVLVIMSILSSISVVGYKRYKRNTRASWIKVELGKVAQNLKSARLTDNGYHQFLYVVGYRPKGEQEGVVSLPSKTTANKACCSNYADLGSSPCGGFIYYNCKNSAPYNKSSNLEICDSNPNCSYDSTLLSVDHGNPIGTGGTADVGCNAKELDSNSNSWCDCNSFTLAGKTLDNSFFTLTERDILCYKKEATGHLEEID